MMRTYDMQQRGDKPKYYYLYKQIREDILNGELKKDEKLPSKRTLAEHLGLGLITVENAYQLLKDDGYIEPRERSGYYVCGIHANRHSQRPEKRLEMLPEPEIIRTEEKGNPLFSEQNDDADDEGKQREGQNRQEDQENPDEKRSMPYSLYFRTVRSVMSEYGPLLMEKSPGEGCAILRNSIARYLLRYRGIYAQPGRIIIGSGAEHLYGCVLRMFGNHCVYGIEDPSYSQIRKVYEGAGAECELLKMGPGGIESEALKNSRADILHVTPFHSYPSGVTAGVSKRYEYLDWAGKGGHVIIEDDFDSEFFMPGKPIGTLFSMDDSESVIYINTFSNSLSPSIRMGYMILPERFMERYRLTNGGFSCTVPVLEQYTLAEFIDKGYFEQHLNRIRRRRRNQNGEKNENI